MAYSIQYGQTIKRKRSRKRSNFLAVTVLILAILLRIFCGAHLDAMRTMIFGEGEAVAVFYEDFVKH